MNKLVDALAAVAVVLASLASSATCIFSAVLATYAAINGDAGLGAIAFAILALVFRLDAELPAFKDAIHQRRE